MARGSRRQQRRVRDMVPDRLVTTVAILQGLEKHGIREVSVRDVLSWLTTDAERPSAEQLEPNPLADPMTGCMPVTAPPSGAAQTP